MKKEKVTPNCWECEHFERIRMYAYCHGGKRVTKLPQKYWYSGQIKFCTTFKKKKGKTMSDNIDVYTQSNEDTISRQAALTEWLNELPSAQADSKELSGTHKALDTVSRQAVIEAINKIFPADPMHDDYTQGITCGAALANIYVAQLPSAQPETHEERTETHACDCNGCKFVGCYDTDFPCANCIRKSKDYYAPERRTDG